jgi:hypothetical protein
MKLSKYLKALQEIYKELGDTELLFTADDAEGNGFTRQHWKPEIRYLRKGENEDRPDELIPMKVDEESDEEWLGCHCIDDGVVADFKKVVLL